MIVDVIRAPHLLAPSDEGAGTPNGVTGGEKMLRYFHIFGIFSVSISPSVQNRRFWTAPSSEGAKALLRSAITIIYICKKGVMISIFKEKEEKP